MSNQPILKKNRLISSPSGGFILIWSVHNVAAGFYNNCRGPSQNGEKTRDTLGHAHWIKDAKLIERARIVLVLSLSKKQPGEMVRVIMDWLDDSEIEPFCRRYLEEPDLAYITRASATLGK